MQFLARRSGGADGNRTHDPLLANHFRVVRLPAGLCEPAGQVVSVVRVGDGCFGVVCGVVRPWCAPESRCLVLGPGVCRGPLVSNAD